MREVPVSALSCKFNPCYRSVAVRFGSIDIVEVPSHSKLETGRELG